MIVNSTSLPGQPRGSDPKTEKSASCSLRNGPAMRGMEHEGHGGLRRVAQCRAVRVEPQDMMGLLARSSLAMGLDASR